MVLLLLTLGLEFSIGEFASSLRRHLPSAWVDLVLNAIPGAIAGWLLGLNAVGILALAGVTYISSSGVIARLLSDLRRLGNRETPAVLSILVLEDFAMAAYLPLLAVLAAGGTWLQALLGVAIAIARAGHRLRRVVSLGPPRRSIGGAPGQRATAAAGSGADIDRGRAGRIRPRLRRRRRVSCRAHPHRRVGPPRPHGVEPAARPLCGDLLPGHRVVGGPRVNEAVNEEWISDKTRFIWDGLRSQRLDRPYVRRGGKLSPASWPEAFAAIREAVARTAPDRIGAIAGDLAAVEEMYALKLLMQSLGSASIDCRQDGAALDPKYGRASYVFNPTIEGIERADAILIIGANPRFEASLLNARIRKRWRAGNVPVGVIGDVGDTRYDYQTIGLGPESLRDLLDGKSSFLDVLKKAVRPLIIVGQGAIARPDGAAVLGLAAKLAQAVEAVTADWNGFAVLHTAAARVGGLDIGFVPGRGGKDVAAMLGGTDVLFLLGADELDLSRAGSAFVVYVGTHGDAGAHRANVILPVCRLHREVRHLRQHRGPRADDQPRRLRAGRGQGGLGDPARFVGRARQAAAVRFAGATARQALCGLSLPCGDRPGRGRQSGRCRQAGGARRQARQGRLRVAGQGFLPHQPDRACFRGHGRMLRARPVGLQAGGRIGTEMDSFFDIYVLPALIILLKSVVLIVVLLIFVAYILYADRKIWAAVQLRRGPNVVGPWGLLQAFADLLKFVFKEPVIPSGANKGIFLLAPLVSSVLAISAWAVIPVSQGWAVADINVGILYVFAISSLEVYGVIMGGWASNSKYPFLGALRSAAQMVSYEVSIGFVIVTVLLCVGSLNLSDIVLAQQDGLGTRLGLPNTLLDWHWLALFPMFIVFFISALAETNRPPFDLVEAESELVAGHMIEYSSTPFLLFFLGEYVAIVLMCALTTILFLGGWLPPVDIAPFTWVPGIIWFVLKVCFVFFMFSMVKAFVPRYRYDQLMRLGWKVFLPISLFMVVATAAVLKLTGMA